MNTLWLCDLVVNVNLTKLLSNPKAQVPRIGFHAPITGGLHNALCVAKETGCDTVQLFSRNPRGAREMDGIETCARSLKLACKGLEFGRLRILLENTAGQGECIGHRFEHLSTIIERCPRLPLAVCVDTAHSFTAGYDIREEDG